MRTSTNNIPIQKDPKKCLRTVSSRNLAVTNSLDLAGEKFMGRQFSIAKATTPSNYAEAAARAFKFKARGRAASIIQEPAGGGRGEGNLFRRSQFFFVVPSSQRYVLSSFLLISLISSPPLPGFCAYTVVFRSFGVQWGCLLLIVLLLILNVA